MRSYILTRRERRAVQAFLAGKISIADPAMSQIRSRLKSFARLREDIDVILRLREAESKAAVSA